MTVPNGRESKELASDSLASRDTIPPSNSDASRASVRRSSSSLPEIFGRYRIERLLGSGGMGDVYLAHDTRLDRRVALKIPKLASDEDRERFYREARAAAGLRHPGICQIFDVDENDGTPYITMAFIDGKALSHYTNRDHPAPEQLAARLVSKIAAAMSEAHGQGVVHRDLKPSNILIDAQRNPVVTDFGLARRVGETSKATLSGTVLGTAEYMPPEQANGEINRIGPRSDIYSLGATFYQLLTGQAPFQGSTGSVIAQVLRDEPRKPAELRPELDTRLETICLKMMAKRIEDRYESMEEVVNELRDVLESPAPSTTDTAASQELRTTTTASGASARGSGKSIKTDQVAKLDRNRKEVGELTKRGQYAAAVQILEQMTQLKNPKLAKYVAWAQKELPRVQAEPERIRRDRDQLLQTAQQFLDKHDYEQAAQLLQQIPAPLRTDEISKVLKQSIELSDEVDFLIRDMDEAVQTREYEGLKPNVERLLKLKPGHRRARDVLKQLKSSGTVRVKETNSSRTVVLNDEPVVRKSLLAALAVFVVVGGIMWIVMQAYLAGGSDHVSDPAMSDIPPTASDALNADGNGGRPLGKTIQSTDPTNDATQSLKMKLVLDADFSTGLHGFANFDADWIKTAHINGEWQYMGKWGGFWFSTPQPQLEVNSEKYFIFEAEARLAQVTAGSWNLRFCNNPGQTYWFSCRYDGRVALRADFPGRSEWLIPWTDVPWINPITETNSYRLEVLPTGIRVLVNGRVVDKVDDNRHAAALMHIYVSPDEVPFDVRFRRIRFWHVSADPTVVSKSPSNAMDRSVAQWVIERGGEVGVRHGDNASKLTAMLADLPSGDISLEFVKFNGQNKIDNAKLPQIFAASNIQAVYLVDTPISDDGLAGLGGLTKLIKLDLGATRVVGPGLAELKSCRDLQWLSLWRTPITDDSLQHVKGLKSLDELLLHETKINGSGLVHVGDCKQLVVLSLNDTQVTDQSLKYLSNLGNLERLGLVRSNVSDAGLVHLSRLRNLVTLDLGGTKVAGPGLRQLNGLKKLRWLSLWTTQISDQSLQFLSNVSPLRELHLTATSINGTGLQNLSGLQNLRRLHLTESPITDVGLARLPSLAKLDALYLKSTKVTDGCLSHLKNFPQLATLDLGVTSVAGTGLGQLQPLKNLRWLSLWRTNLNDDRMQHLQGLTSLHELHLTELKITGSGLKHVQTMSQLKRLFLNGSPITDASLKHLENMSHLEVLGLANTRVTDAGVAALQQKLPKLKIER